MRKPILLCSILSLAAANAQVAPSSSPAVIATPEPSTAEAPATTVPPASTTEVANPNARTAREFQGDETALVIRLLAKQAGINVVVSDQITGNVNMRVENLTPLETIKVIVSAKGLDISQVDNVYYIKTAAEKAKEPTESGYYTFSYAKVGEVLPLIATQILSGVAPQKDDRTNTVFYRDFKSNMSKLALFFDTLDRPTQQVMIEARLVEVNNNPKQSYGINWGGVVGGAQTPQTVQYGGSGLTSYKVVQAQTTTVDPTTGVTTTTPKLDANGFPILSTIVDQLGTVSPTGVSNFVFGGGKGNWLNAIGSQYAILNVPQMSATLRLLNEDSDAEFLANPRVVTSNNQKAQIKITRNQPVPKLNFNEQTATAVFSGFEDKIYGNTLEVTPTINKDNFVTMLVKPEISNRVSDVHFIFGGADVYTPIIDTRSLESNVLIKSGDTLAIGGLLQDESLKNRAKVPALGDIPLLGYMFQEHVNSRTKRNLLVFITPTIIKQGYGTGLEDQVSGLKNSGEIYADPNGWRNNAKGAIRLTPTSYRQNVADAPKPGIAPAPIRDSADPAPAPVREKKADPVKFKVTVPDREQ